MRRALDTSNLELNETIVSIRRVAKTVKGGRNMRFSVTVVVGDGEGHVGVGLGKAQEIPEAVSRNDNPSQTAGRIRSRKSTAHAGCPWYRRNRGFIRTYRSGSRRRQGHQSEVNRFQQHRQHGLRNDGRPQGSHHC